MKTAAKLCAYGAALALLVWGGFAVGTAVGPLVTVTAASGGHGAVSGTADSRHGDTHTGTVPETVGDQPGGLSSSRDGYTLTPTDPTLTPATTEDFAFRITGPDGAPVTAFDVEHVADFTPTGSGRTTLGVDLVAPGTFEPVTHAPSRIAQTDGYTVDLAGDLVPGQASPLTLTVNNEGRPVTDLQPYLAAYGHLVALREADLGYLHVHPEGSPGDGRTPAGPAIEFVAEVPSAGSYRLFLDFQHDGVVRTAEFTVTTRGLGA